MGECVHVDEFCHIQSCIAHTHTCARSVWDPSKLLLSMYTWFWSTCISNVLNLPCCVGFFPQGQGFYFTIQDMLKTDTGNDLKAMRGSGGRKSFILEGTCFQEGLCLVSRQQKANLFDKEGLRDLWRLKISYIYPHIYIHPYIPRQVWENNFFFPVRALILTKEIYWGCTLSFVCSFAILWSEPKPDFQHIVLWGYRRVPLRPASEVLWLSEHILN